MNRWLAALLLAAVAAAPQARDINQDEVLELRRSGQLLPFEALLETVKQRYPDARLLEVELEEEDGRYVYELELLTGSGDARKGLSREGQVRELEIDAITGVVLQDEAED